MSQIESLPDDLEALNNLVANNLAVAVYFSAPKCGVCEVLRPKLQQLFEEYFPVFKFVEVKTEEYPEISGFYGIFSAPTLVVFFEGKEFSRNARNMGIYEVKQKIERPYNLLIT